MSVRFQTTLPTSGPTGIEVPADLAATFNDSSRAAWQKLSFSHQKAHVAAIETAKTAETRARRVASVIEALRV